MARPPYMSGATAEHCDACGHPATAENPLRRAKDGARVHESHFGDPNSGYYRELPILEGP